MQALPSVAGIVTVMVPAPYPMMVMRSRPITQSGPHNKECFSHSLRNTHTLKHTHTYTHTHLEVAVAFRPAEPEYGGVVADKRDAVAGVAVARAEPALFDAHGADPSAVP